MFSFEETMEKRAIEAFLKEEYKLMTRGNKWN
jgi:hypothetical protein